MRVPRITNLFLITAGAVITVFGMRELSWLLGPFLLALMIVILVHPVYRALLRIKVPAVGALLGLLVAVYGIILGLIGIIAISAAQLATILPRYASSVAASWQFLTDQLAGLGIGSDQIRQLVGTIDLLQVARFLTGHLPSLFSAGANMIFLYSLLLFLGVESTQIRRRAASLAADHPALAAALTEFVHNTRRFLAATAVFAVIVGALDTIFLMLIDVPMAPLWGLLAAACNFIPYVGFVIGLIPPALLLLLDGNWQLMIVVIIVYIVLNSIVTTLLPAKIVGDLVGLSMTITMMSVVFWSWVLGPIGSILAVPLSLMTKAVLVDSDPKARWLAGFLNSDSRNRKQQT
ncbi:AI-2E family transporter [Microlunatus endophyticus]|uniref:AI-2E family transporter n=1 Tax=Microlunatus endophyticus TaxID=1716077 RepID=A0A917W8I5_9ACTN|nr:AI-2E family transporter [Microlunatus endophyticus]GGL82535.1 AI-2E family transporter [Microlunatus endophyticus]